MTTTLTPSPAAPARPLVPFGSQGVQLASLEDAFRFSQYVVKSGLAPKGMDTPEAVFVAIQLGAELGLTPMASLQNIAVINGRPGIFGDAALALVRSKDVLVDYKEAEIGEKGKDTYGYRVTLQRKGFAPASEEFTIADAKTAKLWGKAGPWSDYPKRMLKFRARSYILRDHCGDILKGLRTSEELGDIPAEPKNVTPPRGLSESLESAEPPAQEPEPTPEPPPASKAPRTLPPRVNILSSVESVMLGSDISEKRVMEWVAKRHPEAASACEEVRNLPTEILVEIKEALPALED